MDQKFENGLEQAIFGYNPGQFGTQLSQASTLFVNNRWYLVSNMRQLLSEMYVEHGLVQNVCTVPVNDALRKGIIIKSRELDPSDIKQLKFSMDEQGDVRTAGQAMIWNRLFGGAGILIMTESDPKRPFEIEKIPKNAKINLRAVDMWELFWSLINTSDYSAAINYDQLNDVEFYDYYGYKINSTRVMKLKGVEAPSFIRPRLRGWGVSILECMVRSINQYLKTTTLSFEVLDEFKLDIYKVKNLANSLLTQQGTEAVRKRLALANQQKNYLNSIAMDAEDDYIQKQLSFTGLAEVMKGIREQLSADLRIPMSKLFGIPSTGFSSGEDDIENYNAIVESEVREKLKFDLLKIVKIRCQQNFGYIPEDLEIDFHPLRVLSAEQEENVKTQKFSRVLQARQSGEITHKSFCDAVNEDNLLPIQLDPEEEVLDVQQADGSEEGADGDAAPPAAPKGKKSVTEAKTAKS